MARRANNSDPIWVVVIIIFVLGSASSLLFVNQDLLLVFAVIIGIAILLIGGVIISYIRWKEIRDRQALGMSDVDRMSGQNFEKYLARNLLPLQGFTHIKEEGGAGDLGVDITARKNGERYAIQVKRRSDKIDRTAISDAVAAKEKYNATRAMVITNNYFTAQAEDFGRFTNCELVGRNKLADWIVKFQNQKGLFF